MAEAVEAIAATVASYAAGAATAAGTAAAGAGAGASAAAGIGGGIAAAASATGGAIAFLSNVVFYATDALVTVGIYAGAAALLDPKPPKTPSGEVPVRQPTPSRQRLLNTARMSGPVMLEEALNNLYTVVAICDPGPAPLLSYKQFWLNDDEVTLDPSKDDQVIPPGPESGRYKGHGIWIRQRLGLATETSYNDGTVYDHETWDMLGAGIWPTTARGDGVASLGMVCSPVESKDFRAVFPNGVPQPSTRPVAAAYDWRDEAQSLDDPTTWKASTNPFVWLAAYETGVIRGDAGWAANFAKRVEPFIDGWTQAANDCDDPIERNTAGALLTYRRKRSDNKIWVDNIDGLEVGSTIDIGVPLGSEIMGAPAESFTVTSIGGSITGAPENGWELDLSGDLQYIHLVGEQVSWDIADGMTVTEPRYQIAGSFKDENHPADIRKKILDCCDGFTCETGAGGLRVQAGKYRDPYFTMPGEQVLGFTWKNGIPFEKAVNEYKINFLSPGYKWTTVPGVPWEDTADQEARGARLSQALDFDWVPSHGQARRLAKRSMKRGLRNGRGTLRTTLYGLNALFDENNDSPRFMYVTIPNALPDLAAVVVEIRAVRIILSKMSVEFDVIVADPADDDWDPATEEGVIPRLGGMSAQAGVTATGQLLGGGNLVNEAVFDSQAAA